MIYRLLAAVALATFTIYFIFPPRARLVKIDAEDAAYRGGDRGARGNYKTVSEAEKGAGFAARPFSYAAIGAVVLNLLRFVSASLGLTARPRNIPTESSVTMRDSGVCTAEGSVMDDETTESVGSHESDRDMELEVFNEVNQEPPSAS